MGGTAPATSASTAGPSGRSGERTRHRMGREEAAERERRGCGLRAGQAGEGSRGVRSCACRVWACCELGVASLRLVSVPCSLFCCARSLSLPRAAPHPADPTALHAPVPAPRSHRARVPVLCSMVPTSQPVQGTAGNVCRGKSIPLVLVPTRGVWQLRAPLGAEVPPAEAGRAVRRSAATVLS